MPTWGVNVSDEMDEALKVIAEERGATISNLIRQAVAEYLAKQGKPVNTRLTNWGGHRKPKHAKEQSKPSDS